MELGQYFKSIIDSDNSQIVICDLSSTIIYMNPKAISDYEKRGGSSLVGKSLLDCHSEETREKILMVIEWFKKDTSNNIVHTFYNEKHNKDVYMVALRDDQSVLIGYFEKHQFRTKDNSPFYELT